MKRIFAITLTLAASLPLQLAAEPPALSQAEKASRTEVRPAEIQMYRNPPDDSFPEEFRTLVQQGKFVEAWAYAVRESERRPQDVNAWILRIVVRHHEEKNEEALREAKDLVRRFPRSGEAMNERGRCHLGVASFSQAIADFTAAIEMGYDKDIELGNRGSAWTMIGQLQHALDDFQAMENKKAPLLVTTLIRLQRSEEAEAVALEAVKASPTDLPALVALMAACMASGDNHRALEAATRAVQLDPTSYRARKSRATLLGLTGSLPEAIEEQTEGIRLAKTVPERAEGLANRAEIYARWGKADETFADVTAAIDADPNNIDHLYNRMKHCVEVQNWTLALADLTTMIDRVQAGTLKPKTRSLGDLLFLRSNLHGHFGRFPEAIADATAAIEADPTSAENFGLRAECHRMSRDLPLALRDLNAAIDGVRQNKLQVGTTSLAQLYRRRATINLFLGDQAAYAADRAEAERLENEEANKEDEKP